MLRAIFLSEGWQGTCAGVGRGAKEGDGKNVKTSVAGGEVRGAFLRRAGIDLKVGKLGTLPEGQSRSA